MKLIAPVLATAALALMPAPGGASQAPVSEARQPGPVANCRHATIRCVDGNIGRMLAAVNRFGCDHRGVFATAYLVTTEQIKKTLKKHPHYFHDTRWLIYEDTVFSNYYFNAVDEYDRGGPVPSAWRIAFDGARTGDYNAAQDMLLGLNAHIQRDLPFVLATVGLRTPTGATRKPDHNRVYRVLKAAYGPVVGAVTRRYDPLFSVASAKWNPLGDIVATNTERAWREKAWRNAERLLRARTAAERRAVAASIEANAAAWARSIAAVQTSGYRAYRDAYCLSGGRPPLLPALAAPGLG